MLRGAPRPRIPFLRSIKSRRVGRKAIVLTSACIPILQSRTKGSDGSRTWDVTHVFLFLGAQPATKWLAGCLALDERGFIKTGSDLTLPDLVRSGWSAERHPVFLEASKPGIFAVGDVRSGSTKRVASAVGEGSMAIHHVHRYLAQIGS